MSNRKHKSMVDSKLTLSKGSGQTVNAQPNSRGQQLQKGGHVRQSATKRTFEVGPE